LVVLVFVSAMVERSDAKPSCASQVSSYEKWLEPIKAEVAKGAVVSDRVDQLVAIPLQTGSPPDQPAMTIVVDKEGLHDGRKPARPPADAAALIEGNETIAWAKDHKNAISHGIVVLATRDAPAASVHAAVVAAAAAHEQVFLVFRPSDATAVAPAASAVTKEIDQLDSKDVSALVKVIQRDFGPCDGLMGMMQELSSQVESLRLKTLINAPGPALKKCSCKTPPAVAASILWKLMFKNLGVVVLVPDKLIGGLPWGDAKATWETVAGAVVKAITH
jgi:hypothetical protein